MEMKKNIRIFFTTLMLLISYSLDEYDSIAPSKKIEPPTITDEKSTVIVCYKTQKIAKLDFFLRHCSILCYYLCMIKKFLGIVTNFFKKDTTEGLV